MTDTLSPHDLPSDEELGLVPPRSEFIEFPCGCILEVPDEAEGHDVERCVEEQDEDRRYRTTTMCKGSPTAGRFCGGSRCMGRPWMMNSDSGIMSAAGAMRPSRLS
jgi:hypothetical protein